ncbi:MAG: amino acid racemase [Prolixibacteraceae bacterium]|jgi:aspartate racemase|nr:amino acid racemase [Prolixibacteraceae bacterium]
MKKIGLIGGLGPEATVDYYKAIIEAFKGEGKLNYPEIIVYSVNMYTFIGKMEAGDYRGAMDYLAAKLKALQEAGADFLALTANTPHLFFSELQQEVEIPMLSIVEATAREARRLGLKRPGLMGTAFTMNADFFSKVFSIFGMEVVMPSYAQKEYINKKLFSEIELGIFRDETREGLIEIIGQMKAEWQVDGIIMGCTELPLILPGNSYHEIPSLNTTQIHVNEIVKWCKGDT